MTINETVETIQVTESAETITVIENGTLGTIGGGGDGNDGWSPILSIVPDSDRRVLRVADWTGGEGTKPATGSYIGASGFVVAIGDAVDIRGAIGATGAAGSNATNPNFSVATGAAGSSVTISGSYPNLTITIPRGDTGATGSTGAAGQDGASAYVYVAYADDASGTGFTNTFDASKDFIAVKTTTTPIASPQSSDFTGLWKNYKGATGATGATGAAGANATNPNFSVATGAAGSSVVLSGSYPNLTLTIPRGDQGLGGLNGLDGSNGREVALQATATHIQWSYVGDPWTNLIALSELQGEPGADAVLPNPIVYYEKQGAIANGTIDIFPVWPESGTIVGIYGAGLKSGTASANFILNATTITGLGSVSLSTTPGGTVNATANNVFSLGTSTPLKVTISSASSADTLFFWLIFNPD